jgi:Lrp/AsnC family transcriptional regulator
MDRTDKKILAILQQDATIPVADIARKVGLSTTPCWRRIQKMEEDKVIERRVAILNPGKINVGVTVFVSIKTDRHNAEWLKRFSEVISKMPEVIGFYRMSGHIDYLLKVVVPDIGAYDEVYKRLVSEIDIEDVSSTFAMERIKDTVELPLHYLIPDKGPKE